MDKAAFAAIAREELDILKNVKGDDEEMTEVPEMQILSQGNVATEHFSKNGVQKQVNVVVKNIVFMVEIASTVDLGKCNLEAKLLYDYDRDEDKAIEVSYVKSEPLEYKVNILENGYKANVELRIKVLTSQHEDMLFRVRIIAVDTTTQIPFEATTSPIKVISKLTQIKKRDEVASPMGLKKRSSTISTTSNDFLSLSLNRLEQQLEQQQQEFNKYFHFLVNKLFVDPNLPLSSLGQQPGESLQTLSNLITQQSMGEMTEGYGVIHHAEKPKEDFETIAHRFLSAIDEMQPEERRSRVENFLNSVTGSGEERLAEIYDVYQNTPRKKQKE